MTKKLKNLVSILLIIMLLFSQCNLVYANEGTSVDHVVVKAGQDMVILTIGAYANALATGAGNETFDYIAAEGVPLLKAVQAGDKFIGIGAYSTAFAQTESVAQAIISAPAQASEIIMTYKIFGGFDDQGEPILTPLFSEYTVTYRVTGGNGTLTAKAGGTDIVSGTAAAAGSNVVFTVLPAAGCRVHEWKVNGSKVPDETELTYTHRNLSENIEVEVILEEYEMPLIPVLWLDAHDYNADTGVWLDRSGSGNTAQQTDTANRPQLVADGLNGRPVLRFDGSDDYLNLNWANDTLAPDSLTMFLVLKNNDMSGSSQTIMGNYDQEGQVVIHKSGSSPYPITAGISTPIRDNRVTLTSDAGPYVLTYKYDHDATTHTPYVNGSQGENKVKSADINWTDTTIGRNGGPTGSQISEWHWNGDIAEIRIYDSALSDVQRQAIEAELDARWFGPLDPEPISDIIFTAITGLREGTASVADGATIGTLSAVDGIGAITYSLVSGIGDDDNGRFRIDGSRVKINGNALAQGLYSFRAKAQDEEGWLEESFTVTVAEKQDIPSEGLALWLDANDYDAAQGVWPDRSDNGNAVQQTDAANRPQLVADGLNGRPVLRFDGSDDYLNLNWNMDGSNAFTTNFTIFMVMKNNNMTKKTQVVMGNYNSSNEVSIGISSQDGSLVARISSYSNSCKFSEQPGPYVLTFDYDSKTMRAFVDGAETATDSTTDSINWKATAIGKSGTGTANPWAGDIAEIIIYDNALSDSNRQAVEEFLNSKWFGPLDPEPISAINFSAFSSLREGTASVADGATIGTLSAVDGTGAITYSLVSGIGDDDNGCFRIDGSGVKINGNALAQGLYSFRVKAQDEESWLEESFTVTVAEKQDIPSEGLALWLDANDYDAAQGVWPDRSDNSNTVQQTDAANRPQLVAGSLNGQPTVRFDGSDDYLNLNWNMDGNSLTADSITVFMVLKSNNMEDSQTVMGDYDETGALCFHISTRLNLLTATVSHSDNRIDFNDSQDYYVATYKVNASSHTTYINGQQSATASLSESINWSDTTIGRNDGPKSENILDWYWDGNIAEIRIYDTDLSDAEREAIEQDLYIKWFALDEYTVTFDNPQNGVLRAAVDGAPINSGALVLESKDVVFTFEPYEGYEVSKWTVNGEHVSGNPDLTYTHKKLSEDIEVAVTLIETPDREIIGVQELSDIKVKFGTAFDKIGLPDKVEVILEENVTNALCVDWSGAECDYDASVAGTYNLEGVLINLPYGVFNTGGFNASVNVIVSEEANTVSAYVYYNPYEDANWSNQYKANFHTHTNQSDGSIAPAQVIVYYSDAGYDILAITDHDTLGSGPVTPTWPWTEWIEEEPSYTNNNGDMETSAFYPDLGPEGMLAVKGNELSSIDHTASFFNDLGGYSYGQEEKALGDIQDEGGLAMFYHPTRYNRTAQWYANLYTSYYNPPLIGMEVYNQGDRYPSRAIWDEVNAIVLPDIVIFGYSNDDMHTTTHRFRNYQFMLMDDLTEESLRDAMQKGSFYFCYESGGSGNEDPPVPRISSIEFTDDGTVLSITASNWDSITWKTNNGTAGTDSSIDLTTLNPDTDRFVRAELVNSKGITCTQPIVLRNDV